jgi:hypothetical protein
MEDTKNSYSYSKLLLSDLTKNLYKFLILQHATFPAHLILLDLFTLTISGKQYKKLLTMKCSPPSCKFLPLRSTESPQWCSS